MDLLGSILGSMEKPPSVKKPEIKDKEKQKKFEKLQKERQEAAKKHKQMVDKFREDITKQVKEFVNTPTTDNIKTREWKLKPMSKLFRTMVREACEEHEEEIVVHSFGTDEVDRHCVIWKKGCEPCEEEIWAMKVGVEYKPKSEEDENPIEQSKGSKRKSSEPVKDKFWSKYEKVIGENACGVEAARVALPAKQYGCVPIDNKKDQRSIEQMMNDIRKNKKQKVSDEDQGPSTSGKTHPEEAPTEAQATQEEEEQEQGAEEEVIESPAFSGGED